MRFTRVTAGWFALFCALSNGQDVLYVLPTSTTVSPSHIEKEIKKNKRFKTKDVQIFRNYTMLNSAVLNGALPNAIIAEQRAIEDINFSLQKKSKTKKYHVIATGEWDSQGTFSYILLVLKDNAAGKSDNQKNNLIGKRLGIIGFMEDLSMEKFISQILPIQPAQKMFMTNIDALLTSLRAGIIQAMLVEKRHQSHIREKTKMKFLISDIPVQKNELKLVFAVPDTNLLKTWAPALKKFPKKSMRALGIRIWKIQ